MTDPNSERSAGTVTPGDGPSRGEPREKHASSTEGTNRDLDESGESRNQGHSHPREKNDSAE
jgi:hypothetical protein